MVANIIKKNIKYLLLLFFLIFFLLLYISFYIQDLNNTVQTNNLVKKCNKLNYLDSLELKPDKFKSFNLELKIDNNRKWQKILAKNQLSFFKESHYQNKGKINANLIISFNKIKCFLNAEIKPHGDFPKHHANFYLIDNKPVYQGKYKIPNLEKRLLIFRYLS